MLFNYWTILIILGFLPIYYSLTRIWQNVFLIVASCAFYSYWDYRFLSIVVLTTLLNYFFSLKIHSSNNQTTRRTFLIISLFFNLGMLGFFKYCNFFITSFNSAFQSVGFIPDISLLNIILPLGISFFTFKIIGYIIDVYRKNQAPADFLSFALFVSYFPEISAGPIGRAHAFLSQTGTKRFFTKEQVCGWPAAYSLGFFKKKVIADAVAPYVDQLFCNLNTQHKSIDFFAECTCIRCKSMPTSQGIQIS